MLCGLFVVNIVVTFLYFIDRASLYNLANKANLMHNSSQYIYFSFLHISGNCVPIVRRNYCIYATLVFVTLYGWLSGLPVGIHSNRQTRQKPVQSDKYQCRIDTIISPDEGHTVARNI